MATPLDEIEQYERGAAAIRAAAPSLRSYQQPVATAASAAPVQSLGTQAGTAVRRALPVAGAIARGVVNQPIRQLETAANVATAPARAVAGVGRDAVAAAQGQPAANQGQPLAPIRLPRLFSAGSAPAAPAAAPGAAAAAPPENWSPGPRTRPVRTMAPSAPGAGSVATNFNLQPGDVNTFTGSDGRTRAVPGLTTAPPPPAAAPTQVATLNSTAPRVQETTRRTLDGIRNSATTARQEVGAGLNPMSDQAELMRRLEISQGSFRGSPSARAAAARAILGQMDALTDATAEGQRGANAALTQGATQEAAANESFVRRRLDTDQFNVNTQERRLQNDAENTAATEVLRSQDGTASALRRDGTLRRLTNEDGTPFRAANVTQQSGITADSLLKSYTDRVAAIEQGVGTPDEKRAAVEALNADPLYASLRGGNRNGAPYEEGARLRGPGGKTYIVRNGQPVLEK